MDTKNLLRSIDTLLAEKNTKRFAVGDVTALVTEISSHEDLNGLVQTVIQGDIYCEELAAAFQSRSAIAGLSAVRMLRSTFSMPLGQFVQQIAILLRAFDPLIGNDWARLASRVQESSISRWKTLDCLKQGSFRAEYLRLELELADERPHAVYPTSPFRESSGSVVSQADFQQVDAYMSSTTHTSIKVVENVLDADNSLLREIYKPLGRCICLIDENVERFFGWRVESYFASHGIELEKLVYRGMEVDKGIRTVERMLGDFKHLGVSRSESVLIMGGGVIADTGGLACALYHRGIPYVMLSTSVVAGIDAGPSPRTCCDGFGYKNLFGAYHAPILSITDRTLFQTLRPGWVRHGIAEIIKMATVKDAELFAALEQAGTDLIDTRFGSLNTPEDAAICDLSRQILGRAIKSYVEAEYGNLYETHQCRPHAFGHTWSPGFEIPAGLLHGHAVSIGMGFGAFLSEKEGWISKEDRDRIHRLIASFDLSLWHEVLTDRDQIWAAQEKMTEKRGGHLAAPLPQHAIGQCGYLPHLTQQQLFASLSDYQRHCETLPRSGRGIEAHCHEVGLEDPSTVGESLTMSQ